MENYPQNNMQGNTPDNTNYQPTNNRKKSVVITIIIEYILMIIGIVIAVKSVPDVELPIYIAGSSHGINLKNSIFEMLLQLINAIIFFLVNPIICTSICNDKLKRIGTTSGVKITTTIITLLPIICFLITISLPIVQVIYLSRK